MVSEEVKKMLGNVGIDEEYLLYQAKNIIDNIDGRDSDKLRGAIEMLMKISGMFPNDKKTESLTVFQGFTPDQLKELEPSQVKVIGHMRKRYRSSISQRTCLLYKLVVQSVRYVIKN